MSIKTRIDQWLAYLRKKDENSDQDGSEEKEVITDKTGGAASLDKQEQAFFKLALLIVLGTLFIMVFSFLVSFLVTLRGKEETLVPDLTQQELVQGLMDLQEKELYPRVQVRFSSNPADKGRIIDQDPSPGTVVKAGKRVTLVVSKGSVVDKVGTYVGKDLLQVRMDIQALFSSQRPLLRIKDPVTYIYDDTPQGTILEQKPAPGTEISGLTELELWVSRGPKGDTVTVDNFLGMEFAQALDTLGRNNMVFSFKVQETSDQEPGLILSQTPAPGTQAERGERISLIMSPPEDLKKDEVFGLFQLTLEDYPVAVDMRLESESLSGIRETLFEFKHPGGDVSIPYVQPDGRDLVLYVYDREVHRVVVKKPESEE